MEDIIALGYSNGSQQSSVDDYLGQIEAMIGSSLLDDFLTTLSTGSQTMRKHHYLT